MNKESQLKKSNFIVNASGLFFITLCLKILGLFREILIAAYIGMNQSTDAYNTAIMATSLISGVFGIALSSTIIPILSKIRNTKGVEEQERFISNVFWTMMILAFAIAALLYIFSVPVVTIIAPGFDDATVLMSARLFRIGFIKINLIVATTLFTQYLNYKSCFYSPMIGASIGTILIVGYFVIAGNSSNVLTLMMLTVVSYLVEILWIIPSLVKNKFKIRPYLNLKESNMIMLYILALPAILSNVAQQIGTVINRALATQLSVGSVTALSYANSIVMMINMTVSLSIATVIFPRLSEHLSANAIESAVGFFKQGILLATTLLLPATFGIILLAEPICSVLFERGVFTAENSVMTSIALVGYSIGIITYAYYAIGSRFFNAMQNTKTPMMVTYVGVIIMIILSFLLYKPLELLGLALSLSAMQIVMAIILLAIINNKYSRIFDQEFIIKLGRVLIATIIMSIGLLYLRDIFFYDKIISLVIVVFMAMLVYILSLVIFAVHTKAYLFVKGWF